MEDCERKYKEAFNMAVLEHKSDNEAVRESIERIFPQLKEPEDEKIRKALISAINNICNSDEGLVTFNGFSKEQVLTWLEKQSTPQVRTGLEWGNTIDNACDKRYAEEYADGEYCHEQSFKWGFQEGVEWLENQGGQKPADKSEGCNNAKGCVACVDGSEWAHIEEQNPAWGEEDEEMLRRCISATFDHGYLRECDWLKSLKDRVGCEVNSTATSEPVVRENKGNDGGISPNSEWSEEDEEQLSFCCAAIEMSSYANVDDRTRAVSWLGLLKDRVGNFDDGCKVGFSAAKHNQWKPSDEQIKILSIYAGQNNYHGTVLTSLYKDLKKLKG